MNTERKPLWPLEMKENNEQWNKQNRFGSFKIWTNLIYLI